MASVNRILNRVSYARAPFRAYAIQPRRFAHQSYGNEQSGHEQGINEENPKRHTEHPGPDAPATKGSSNKSASSGSSATTANAKPKIHQPESAAEENDPEVRKHNEEMRHRADRSANQLSEDDNKVDKKFWQGDVGDNKQVKK